MRRIQMVTLCYTLLRIGVSRQGPIRYLMALGADKNVTNARGKMPNVVTNDARQDTRDFTGAFGLIGAFENEMRNMNESIALLENAVVAARSGGPNHSRGGFYFIWTSYVSSIICVQQWNRMPAHK